MQPRIRVAYIVTRLVRGGAQGTLLLTGGSLDRERYEVDCFSGPPDGEEGDYIDLSREKNLEVKWISCLQREINFLKDLRALFRIIRILQDGKYDIVHTYTSKAGFIGRLAARIARVPVVVHSPQGHIFTDRAEIPNVSDRPLMKKLFYYLEKLSSYYTDKIIALTDLECQEQVKLRIAPSDKFVTIHNPVDISKFRDVNVIQADVRKSLRLPEEGRILVCVGRLSSEKGQSFLIDAFAQLSQRQDDVFLCIIGSGALRESLEKQAGDLGIGGKVFFTGLREDIPSLLPAFDMFVLPSKYEGQGVVILEAMAAGLPVIATRVGGVPEIITHEKTGLLVEYGDISSLASACEKVLTDTSTSETLRNEGKKLVSDKFGVSSTMEKLQELYESLLASKRSRGVLYKSS